MKPITKEELEEWLEYAPNQRAEHDTASDVAVMLERTIDALVHLSREHWRVWWERELVEDGSYALQIKELASVNLPGEEGPTDPYDADRKARQHVREPGPWRKEDPNAEE